MALDRWSRAREPGESHKHADGLPSLEGSPSPLPRCCWSYLFSSAGNIVESMLQVNARPWRSESGAP